MVYFDTSAVVPLFVNEAASARVRAQLLALQPGDAVLSHWTMLEFSGAIGARVRGGSLSEAAGREAVATLQELAEASWRVVPPEASDFELARGWIEGFNKGLKSGDALHLVIAYRISASLFTLDRRLQAAARAHGVALLRS